MDKIIFGNYELTTLVALTDEEQRRGLMHVSWPPPVMSFPYESAKIHKFWMKNTVCPLDIVFCRNGKVISVMNGEPLSLRHIGPDIPSDLVVELPKGMAQHLDIVQGTSTKLICGLFTLAKKLELKMLKKC